MALKDWSGGIEMNEWPYLIRWRKYTKNYLHEIFVGSISRGEPKYEVTIQKLYKAKISKKQKTFKTKSQALKYAKAYMRKN